MDFEFIREQTPLYIEAAKLTLHMAVIGVLLAIVVGKMFYCDANAPYQKGSCENNHELIRRIIPKGTDIGRYTQEQINLMMSHINSYSRKKLGNKSPYEVFEFQYGKKILDAFHLQKIPADEIVLSPELLK